MNEHARPILHEAIQRTNATDEDLDGAVLMGWVVIAEWMAPTGERWLSKVAGNASGEGCPEWQTQGYLHNALFHPEDFRGEGDRDEDDGE